MFDTKFPLLLKRLGIMSSFFLQIIINKENNFLKKRDNVLNLFTLVLSVKKIIYFRNLVFDLILIAKNAYFKIKIH